MAVSRVSDTARARRADLRKGYPLAGKGVVAPRALDDQMIPGRDRAALRENKAAPDRTTPGVRMGGGGRIQRVDDDAPVRKKPARDEYSPARKPAGMYENRDKRMQTKALENTVGPQEQRMEMRGVKRRKSANRT